MKRNDVIDLVRGELWPQYADERRRLKKIDQWYQTTHPDVYVPRSATQELRRLAALAKTPWLALVVNVMSQTMMVDGFKSPDDNADSAAWRTWRGNKFAARQVAIHKGALAYGYAFGTALPGEAPDGSPMSVLRGVSPLSMTALYSDPAEDDWPMFAMRVFGDQPGDRVALRVFDEVDTHYLSASMTGDDIEWLSSSSHGAGVCPVVRYANLDLEGCATGQVEPFIPIAARINKTDYDRLLTQHFASWKIRYATGMARPENDAEAAATKMRLRQDDFLIAEDPDTKFGTLDGSPLDGFIAAKTEEVHTLAAVSQTPTPALTGDLINLSADALASVRAQLDQKSGEYKIAFGESHAQLLRLAARLEGDETAANDVAARITWQDTSIRSIAAAVDALGKAAQMLNVPVRALWPMIPGVTKADVEDWKRLALEGDPMQAVQAMLDRQAGALNGPQPPQTGVAA